MQDKNPCYSTLILPASKAHNYNTRRVLKQNLCRSVSIRNYGLTRFKVVALIKNLGSDSS